MQSEDFRPLRECPFCGGKVEIDMLDSENSRNVKIYSAVHCPKCHEWFFKGLSKEKTVAAWNRRVDARQLALKTRVCPMCEDCPDGCPVETPKDSRNKPENEPLSCEGCVDYDFDDDDVKCYGCKRLVRTTDLYRRRPERSEG
jgi:hypothetical protein